MSVADLATACGFVLGVVVVTSALAVAIFWSLAKLLTAGTDAARLLRLVQLRRRRAVSL